MAIGKSFSLHMKIACRTGQRPLLLNGPKHARSLSSVLRAVDPIAILRYL